MSSPILNVMTHIPPTLYCGQQAGKPLTSVRDRQHRGSSGLRQGVRDTADVIEFVLLVELRGQLCQPIFSSSIETLRSEKAVDRGSSSQSTCLNFTLPSKEEPHITGRKSSALMADCSDSL